MVLHHFFPLSLVLCSSPHDFDLWFEYVKGNRLSHYKGGVSLVINLAQLINSVSYSRATMKLDWSQDLKKEDSNILTPDRGN